MRENPARLIVIRGNSASGKSAVAGELRRRHGRGLAIVGQDNLRRQVLRERDVPGAANIDLIDLTARFALDRGFHVIVEGILYADHYGRMLTALIAGTRGLARAYYLDVPWAETLRRHASKPQAAEYGETRDARLVPRPRPPPGRARAGHPGGRHWTRRCGGS